MLAKVTLVSKNTVHHLKKEGIVLALLMCLILRVIDSTGDVVMASYKLHMCFLTQNERCLSLVHMFVCNDSIAVLVLKSMDPLKSNLDRSLVNIAFDFSYCALFS